MGYSTGRKPWRSEPWRSELTPEAEVNRVVRGRIMLFGCAILLVFGILTVQLARMQLINGEEYRARAESNRLREEPIIPIRGLIYDRNGVPLVENEASFAAAVVAADVPEERQTEITIALQELTGVPASEIEAEIEQRRDSNDPFTPAIVKANLTNEQAFMLRERLAALPGVRVVVEPVRHYTHGPLVSHVLGYVGPLNQEEYAELQNAGYEFNDRIGKTGIEYMYESSLRGQPGVRQVETDASGRQLRVIDQRAATPGSNVVLSIDLDLQAKTEEILREFQGESLNAAAVVMDVHTGEILALVSLPTYDNNIFTGEVDEAALQAIQEDPGKPLLNHAITEVYPPGSTFKQITGLAALEEGVATADTQITSTGILRVQNEYLPDEYDEFRDWATLGTLNFYRGVAMSSNIYFYYLAGGYVQNGQQVFEGLGPRTLAEWARRFGLGERTGIDLPGESAGTVPDPQWKEETVGEPWYLGDTYNFGIGQGYTRATPIQMLLVTAAVANGGDLLIPHLVKEIQTPGGETVSPLRDTVKRNLGIDIRNLEIMREGMRQAVENGASSSGKSNAVVIAGKTGTAEFGQQRADGSYTEHGWFTGYAPFNDPQVAVVVFFERGGGALSAAPAASKILTYYFERQTAASGENP